MTRQRIIAVVLGAALVVVGAVAGAWWQGSRAPATEALTLTPVEVGFAQDMSTHHLQALELCNALTVDVDVLIERLCDQIQGSQNYEIGMMSGWLALMDEPQTSQHPMEWMESGEHAHGGSPMPGMASWMEIDDLRQADGREAETLFLQLMIRHHQGGLEMAGYAAAHAENRAVAQLATVMIKDQSEEAAVMERLLRERGGEPLPFP